MTNITNGNAVSKSFDLDEIRLELENSEQLRNELFETDELKRLIKHVTGLEIYEE